MPQPPAAERSHWQTLRNLLPWLWPANEPGLRLRVVIAVACLIASKSANVLVPLVYARAVDALAPKSGPAAMLAIPLALLVAYGLLRLSTRCSPSCATPCSPRSRPARGAPHRAVASSATCTRCRCASTSTRQTGGLSRDDRARHARHRRSCSASLLFNILPTLVEIVLGAGDPRGGCYDCRRSPRSPCGRVVLYIAFTVDRSPNGACSFRREMNERDSEANTKAIDSLLNYETVKYFGNEEYEARRYDESLQRYERAAVRSQTLAVAAQHRPGRDHRDRPRRGDAAGAPRGVVGGHDDARRLRAGQRLSDPALHPAQLPRRGLPRDQAGADRHGGDVRAAGASRRDRGPARTRRRCVAGAGGALRATSTSATTATGRSCTTSRFAMPPGRHASRSSARSGAGKSTHLAAAVPLLRRRRRAHPDRRPGHPRRHAGQPARARSASCRRTPCCSTTRSTTTSPTAGPARRRRRSRRPRGSRRSTISSLRLPDGYETHGRRARPEALGRREAARRHRPRDPEGPAHPDLRRGDLGARHPDRAGDPGQPRAGLRRPHHAGHRPPPVDGRRCRRDPGAGGRPHRRARHPCGAARRGRPLCRDVAAPAGGGRDGGSRRGGPGRGRPRPAAGRAAPRRWRRPADPARPTRPRRSRWTQRWVASGGGGFTPAHPPYLHRNRRALHATRPPGRGPG